MRGDIRSVEQARDALDHRLRQVCPVEIHIDFVWVDLAEIPIRSETRAQVSKVLRGGVNRAHDPRSELVHDLLAERTVGRFGCSRGCCATR